MPGKKAKEKRKVCGKLLKFYKNVGANAIVYTRKTNKNTNDVKIKADVRVFNRCIRCL